MTAWKNSGNNDICPKGFSVPTRKELAAETTLAEKNPINNKTIKDGNGTALAFSIFNTTNAKTEIFNISLSIGEICIVGSDK
jgi:hypothetical protein